MNIAERLKQDGFQQGIHAGIQRGKMEGEQEAKITVAKNLLSKRIKIEVIKSATGLADEIISTLIQKH